jgi:hypothetical protein
MIIVNRLEISTDWRIPLDVNVPCMHPTYHDTPYEVGGGCIDCQSVMFKYSAVRQCIFNSLVSISLLNRQIFIL